MLFSQITARTPLVRRKLACSCEVSSWKWRLYHKLSGLYSFTKNNFNSNETDFSPSHKQIFFFKTFPKKSIGYIDFFYWLWNFDSLDSGKCTKPKKRCVRNQLSSCYGEFHEEFGEIFVFRFVQSFGSIICYRVS